MKYTVDGTALIEFVKDNNLTAYEFCKKYDVKISTFNKIVHGKKVPLTTLFILSHKINLSLNDFLA